MCVCVCASLAASHYHIEKFLSCTADKGGGRGKEEGGREGWRRKERVCLRKNNKLPLIWLLAHPVLLSPPLSFSLSLSLSLSASPSDCITAECEAAIHIHWRGTPAVFAAVSSLCIIFFFFRFSISIYLLPTLLLSQLPPISISSHLSPPLSTSVNPLSFSSLCLSSIFLFIVSLSFALYFVSLSIILALISLPALSFSLSASWSRIQIRRTATAKCFHAYGNNEGN